MTIPQKRAIKTGVLTLLIGALVLGAVDVAREKVIYRPEFALHAQQVKSEIGDVKSELNAEINDVRGIALDILCTDHPQHWRCK